jgi:hypothetical protein
MAGRWVERAGEWVLLSYRVPRVPSAPRIAIWRRLKRLGVAQLGDGLVALPCDARTREQLEWVADEVIEARGTASIWLARPASQAHERELAEQMAAARAVEYAAVIGAAAELAGEGRQAKESAVRRLRAQLRKIGRRDHFPPPERDQTRAAVQELVDQDGPPAAGLPVESGAVGSRSDQKGE